jgi:RimJ/RimL family protein N-acetyltransferase
MPNIRITTKRLVLEDISLVHANEMFEYRCNEDISKFQSFQPKTIEEVNTFITDNTKYFNIENYWYQMGIFFNIKMIGDIGIHFMAPDNKQCELGYTINSSFQKKGFGKESVVGIIDYLFKKLEKHRITASLNPDNIASIALLESIGFRREGHFRKVYLTKEGGKMISFMHY